MVVTVLRTVHYLISIWVNYSKIADTETKEIEVCQTWLKGGDIISVDQEEVGQVLLVRFVKEVDGYELCNVHIEELLILNKGSYLFRLFSPPQTVLNLSLDCCRIL